MGREQKGRGSGVGVPNVKTPSRGLIFRSARTGTLATQANSNSFTASKLVTFLISG